MYDLPRNWSAKDRPLPKIQDKRGEKAALKKTKTDESTQGWLANARVNKHFYSIAGRASLFSSPHRLHVLATVATISSLFSSFCFIDILHALPNMRDDLRIPDVDRSVNRWHVLWPKLS